MLKVTPDRGIARAEAFALGSWASSGHVPLVWGYDPALGVPLLEAIADERPLAETGGPVHLGKVVCVIDALHRSGTPVLSNGVVPLADRVEFVFGYWIERYRQIPTVTDVVPSTHPCRGHQLARRLAVEASASVLLHGDLHPGNVLDDGDARGLVAIDPRPCVGEAAYDAMDWVFTTADNPLRWETRSQGLASALEIKHNRL